MKTSIFIGRFQPFHSAHKIIIEKTLLTSDRIIVAIGSAGATLGLRDPWTYEERVTMINENFSNDKRILITPLRDFMYNDAIWIAGLQHIVNTFVNPKDEIQLVGHFKDNTSEYLKFFPQWKLKTVENIGNISATEIRKLYFSGKDHWTPYVPKTVRTFLEKFKENERYKTLVDEHKYIEGYKNSWSIAPFPPTFVTVDAVVMQAGHILVVKRGINPGKGKFALPGGFLGQTERILDAAIRELREETSISVSTITLKKNLKEIHVFDHPNRSMRGRTITHAHFFILDNENLPLVKGDDDAAEAIWMPISDINRNEEKFHEDHVHIISHFVYKGY